MVRIKIPSYCFGWIDSCNIGRCMRSNIGGLIIEYMRSNIGRPNNRMHVIQYYVLGRTTYCHHIILSPTSPHLYCTPPHLYCTPPHLYRTPPSTQPINRTQDTTLASWSCTESLMARCTFDVLTPCFRLPHLLDVLDVALSSSTLPACFLHALSGWFIMLLQRCFLGC
jgi:hypothetical protein